MLSSAPATFSVEFSNQSAQSIIGFHAAIAVAQALQQFDALVEFFRAQGVHAAPLLHILGGVTLGSTGV